MSIADTSNGSFRFVKEATIGTTPASALTELRFTGETLTQDIVTETSKEIRSDGQISDLIRLDSNPSGDVQFELSYNNIDDFLVGALLSSGWSTEVAISETDIDAVQSDNSYNTVAGDFTLENLSVGQMIKPAGFTDPANNDFGRIVSITATKIVVSESTLVDESAGARTFTGSMIRNERVASGFTLEAEFGDITQFKNQTGGEVNTFALDITKNAVVTGSLGFVSRSQSLVQATVGTGAHNAAATNDVMSTTLGMSVIRENGALLGAFVSAVPFSIDNALRGQKAIGVDGNIGTGKSQFNVTGSLTSYFQDEVLYNKLLNNTATSLSYAIDDAAGNTYIITFPKMKYTSGNPEIGGLDADVELTLDWQALRDPVTDATMQIDKFAG